jgi:transcriptional regulator with GAF, ATPase, and Fis domain
MTTVSRERLSEVFIEMADTLVEDFDVIDFLHTVTTRTAELVDVAAVGIMLADHRDRLRFVAASNEAARLLELFQVQNDEGPCLDAFTTRRAVVNADLLHAVDRWPLFAPRATSVGMRSVHAIPLRLRSTVIGALNLFGTTTGTIGPGDLAVVQALADIATIGLLQQRAISRGEVLTEQLQGALNSRVTIEQAKGVLSRIHAVDVDQAFGLLRRYARNTNRRLSDVALAVVNEPASVAELTRGSGPAQPPH